MIQSSQNQASENLFIFLKQSHLQIQFQTLSKSVLIFLLVKNAFINNEPVS